MIQRVRCASHADSAVLERLSQNIQQAEAAQEEAQTCEDRLHNRSDLDAQWAAALSARNAAKVSLIQLRWSAIEFAALSLTLLAAGWAAWEARKAAHAARDMLDFEREPILLAKIEGGFDDIPIISDGRWVFRVVLEIRNAGRGPATVIDVHHRIAPGLDEHERLLPGMLKDRYILASGEWIDPPLSFSLRGSKSVRRNIADYKEEAPLQTVTIQALYQTGSGALMVYGAAWKYSGFMVDFIPTGGPKFNYVKPAAEVKPDMIDFERRFRDPAPEMRAAAAKAQQDVENESNSPKQ